MYDAHQPASNGGTRIQVVDGVEYRADRVYPDGEPGWGWIELRGFISGQRLACVSYDAGTGGLTMQTFTAPLPQVAVEWLFAEGARSLR